jgi:HEAT repeat protein
MRFSAVWTLSSLGPPQAPALARALRDDDAEVRLLAAQCLGDLEARAQADALAGLLSDEVDDVRFAAATALAALGDARGASVLRASLEKPARAFPAAIGLGDLKDEASRSALLRLAKRRMRSPILRAAAARALVRLGDPEGVMLIRKLVRSWRIEARQYAVQLVGELGLTQLVPDLSKALRRSRPAERAVYETTLERLAPKSSQAVALLASLRQAEHSS